MNNGEIYIFNQTLNEYQLSRNDSMSGSTRIIVSELFPNRIIIGSQSFIGDKFLLRMTIN